MEPGKFVLDLTNYWSQCFNPSGNLQLLNSVFEDSFLFYIIYVVLQRM